MANPTDWQRAPSPDYVTNVDLHCAFSNLPYDSATCVHDVLGMTIVDYWGEGLIRDRELITGFSISYNVNHQYQLVSNGTSKHHKIPNRIPVRDYDVCDTSPFIMDDSVMAVASMGAPINDSCAQDIRRMINTRGIVVVYDLAPDNGGNTLTLTLFTKGFFIDSHFTLGPEFSHITIEKPCTYRFYSNSEASTQRFRIKNKHFQKYLKLGWKQDSEGDYHAYAGKLEPSNEARFAWTFQFVKNNVLEIANCHFHDKKLKLQWKEDGDGDRGAFGGSFEAGNADRFQWEFNLDLVESNTFTIKNVRFQKYLKLGWSVDGDGDNTAYGGAFENQNQNRFKWELECC